jgi:NAD(P)-dependent dehydrogenase (short-subunit alcohol dehydrogenase family)
VLLFTFLFISMLFLSFLDANTVLITGANRGIGLEFARQYKAKGYDVIGTARKPEEASKLRALGFVRIEQLDVADPSSVAALAKRLSGIPIDLLINNAGILQGRNSTLETLNIDELSQSFAVNSIGPLRVSQALLPNLRAGKQKKIINLTSTLGSIQNNTGGMYPYRASKTALNQLTKTMSIDLGREGFVCIVMHPGWVRTDMGGAMGTYNPEDSVRSMINVIDKLDLRSNGQFLDLKGDQISW